MLRVYAYGVSPIEEALNQLYQTKDSWLACKVFQALDNPNVVFGSVEYEHDEEGCFEYMQMYGVSPIEEVHKTGWGRIITSFPSILYFVADH